MANKFKVKRGTNLSNITTAPEAGELIYKSDTKQLFVGDGSTAASALTPIGGASTSGSNNQILTDDGSGGITSESSLEFAGQFLTIKGNDPSNTYGVKEKLRIHRSGANTDRQLQIYEMRHSGGREFLQAFNLDITTDNSSGYTYTQGSYGGSSHLEFDNAGALKIYNDSSVSSGSRNALTPSLSMWIKDDNNILMTGRLGIGWTNGLPARALDVKGGIELSANDDTLDTNNFALRRDSGGGGNIDVPGDMTINLDANDNQTDAVFEICANGSATGVFKVGETGIVTTGTWQGTAIDATYVGSLPASKITSGAFDIDRLPTKDEDDMASDSDQHIPTQQSVKAYVDSQSSGAVSAVANGADNRIATFSSSTALYGESNLTFSSLTLQIPSASGKVSVDTLLGYSNNTNKLLFNDDQDSANNQVSLQSINHINVMTDGNNNGTGNFKVWNGSYDVDTADLAFQIGATSNATFYGNVTISQGGDLNVDNNTLFVDGSANNVGIGTNSPDRRLTVTGGAIVTAKFASTSGTGHLVDMISDNATDGYNGFRFYEQTNHRMSLSHIQTGTRGYMQIGNSWASGSEILVVDGDNSRVGIGTASPGNKLEVRGDIAVAISDTQDIIKLSDAGNDGSIELYTGEATPVLRTKLTAYGDSYFNGSSVKLGIGTSSPAQKLHIYDSSSSAQIHLQTTADASAQIRHQNDNISVYTGVSSADQYVWYHSSLGANVGFIPTSGVLYWNKNILLNNNNTTLVGRETGGTTRNMVKMNTSNQVEVGSSSNVLKVPATNSIFSNAVKLESELDFTGNSDKYIDVETLENSNSFRIRNHNPVGNVFHDALKLVGNGGAYLYYNNSKKFETTNTGATVTGALNVTGALSFGSISGAISTTGNINTGGAYQMDGTTIIDSSKIPINIADPHGTDRAGSVLVTDYAGVTSPTADGWYTIAKGTVHDARGGGIIGIGFTGGYASPKTFTCDFQVGWGGELHRCNISNETDVIVKVRLITTSSTTELQAYFNISSGLSDNPQTMRVTFTRDKYNPYWSIEDPLTQVASPLETREETNVNGRGVKFYSSDTNTFEINNSHFVFNELSKDVNFRVESNGDANMLFVDGGTNRVGIGTGSPDSELHVSNNTANLKIESTGSGNASYLHIKNTTNQYDIFNNAGNLQIDVNGVATRFKIHSDGLVRSNSNHVFGAENTNSKAYIRANNGYSTAATPDYTFWYNDTCGIFHPAANTIGFSVGNNEMGRFTTTGLGIGTTSPSHKVHIASNSSTNSVLRIDGDDARGGNRYALDVQDDDANRRGVARFRHTTGSGNPPILIAEGYDHAYIFQSKNTSASDAEQFRIEHYDGNVYIDSRRGNLGLYATGGSVVVPSQNVGIGVTSPSALLDVGGDADVFALIGRARIGFNSHTDYASFQHRDSATSGGYALLQQNNGTTYLNSSGNMHFRVGNVDKMKMDSSGNLGIGTNSPSAKLEVNGTSNFTGEMYIDHGGSDYAPGINFMGGTNTPGSNTYENCKLAYYDNSGTGFMRYTIGRSAGTHSFRIGGNEVFYVDAAGQGRFRGSSDINMVVESTDSGGGIAIKDSNTSGDYYNGIFVDGNELFFKANNSERMRIDSSGKVAIAHNDPDALLHINPGNALCNVKLERQGVVAWRFGIDTNNANLKFDAGDDALGGPEFLITTNGAGHFDNDVIAFSNSTGSDKRLKKNIKPIPYGLKEVLQMNPVEYDWKEKRDESHDIGVIAQEIEEIIPEVVKEHEDLKTQKEFKTVDYGKMVAVLIKAVQEQQQQINELKEKLNG